MNTFILTVALISTGSYRPPAIIVNEFSSQQKCQVALDYWQKQKHKDAVFAGGGCFAK